MKATAPTQSGRRADWARDSLTRLIVIARATSPTGRLTKKIHRHDSPDVSAPPSSGPIATATPVTAPQIPSATPRSLPWKVLASRASETENMIAPPTPCAPREISRNRWPGAIPHNMEATVNTASPMA